MNSLKRLFASLAIIAGALIAVAPVSAQQFLEDATNRQGEEIQQEMKEPRLQVNIPDVTFSRTIMQNGNVTVPYIAQYVAGIYKFLISIVGVLAGVMLMIGGFQYLTSGGDASRAQKGRERIVNALAGVALALGSYLILFTINPNLVEFKSLEYAQVTQVDFVENDGGDVGAGDPVSPSQPIKGKACTTIAECKTLCAKPVSQWPTTTSTVLDPSLAQTIPAFSNIQNPNAQKAARELIAALSKVNESAKRESATVVITSGYRPLQRQIEIVCRFLKEGRGSEIGTAVAWPGGSNHGSGRAIDVKLIKDGKALTTVVFRDQGGAVYKDGSILLDKIMMAGSGFKRYSAEIWHYEFGTSTTTSRCTYPNCPFPPHK